MTEAFICDFTRTPIGRYAGALRDVRTDDLAAHPIKALMARNAQVDWQALDDCILGCANQAGEDNRNVARMAVLLSGLPANVSGATINRLCGSGLDAVGTAARAIRAGEAELMLAGGVESMTRAPFVMGKATEAFSRSSEVYDTTIGWRFVNAQMQKVYGTDSMPETGENVAEEFQISRQDQDKFAYRSQMRAAKAQSSGFFAKEITPVTIKGRKGDTVVDKDEHPRADTTLEGAGQAAYAVPRSRHGDGRQRIGRERWGGGADHRFGRCGAAARSHAAGARGGDGDRRRAATHHGHRPGAGGAEAA